MSDPRRAQGGDPMKERPMTFDEFIKDGLGKADILFGKLAQSGPNAVKTRERLFADLKAELGQLSHFERHHLIPVLGDQKKTRPLVKALEKDNEKVADLLAELETAPRGGDAFLQKLTELHAAFQAHVRTERKALLPAVLDALHRAQTAEQDAAEQEAAARAAAEHEAAELKAAELKAAELKAAQAQAEAKAAIIADAIPAQVLAEPDELPRVPLPIPAPLAAIAILQTIAPPIAPLAIDLPKPLALPLPTPTYGVQAWANLMQEAAAGAMMGYRLMMAYSNNTGFAALQTRLMKEQIELMTKSGAKMIEAAQRFTKTAG
jgi:hypothetical protein